MPDQTLALAQAEPFPFKPQDRSLWPLAGSIASTLLSILIVGAALYQARELDLARIARMVPHGAIFWAIFAINYMVVPISEYVIFRRLWGIGPGAIGALMRKLVCNELLLGYLGEAYFYGWARKHLKFVTTPFGPVKDVAVLSAVAGNLTTLAFLALAFPVVRLLPLHDHATAIGWSLGIVMATSLVVMFWRGAIFSLPRRDLQFVFGVHLVRILLNAFFSAVLWHLVLPDIALGWWLVMVTLRLLISRLPLVPNKDVVFAGIAAVALGSEVHIAELMALMAALILASHILVGLTFGVADLVTKASSDEPRLG